MALVERKSSLSLLCAVACSHCVSTEMRWRLAHEKEVSLPVRLGRCYRDALATPIHASVLLATAKVASHSVQQCTVHTHTHTPALPSSNPTKI